MKEEDIISYQEIPPESEQSTEMKLELSEVKYYYACVIIIFTLCMQKMRSIHKLEALSPKRHETIVQLCKLQTVYNPTMLLAGHQCNRYLHLGSCFF